MTKELKTYYFIPDYPKSVCGGQTDLVKIRSRFSN